MEMLSLADDEALLEDSFRSRVGCRQRVQVAIV